MTEKTTDKGSVAITVSVCIAIVVTAVVAALALYNINDRNNMAKNIDSAIQKGVDPISVKCSYEMSPTSTCIAYAMNTRK